MINIIEVIQTIGFALDEVVHAIMYYMPAKGAIRSQPCVASAARKSFWHARST